MRTVGFLFVVWSIAVSAARGQAPAAWELTPYRVQTVVAFDPAAPALTPRARAEVLDSLESGAATVIGGAWELNVAEADRALRPAMLRGLESLTIDGLPSPLLSDDRDKVLFLCMTEHAGSVRIESREFDTATRQLGAVIVRASRQRERLCDEAFAALRSAFEPLARIENVDAETVELSLRGGALASQDPALMPTTVGAIFRPVVRRTTRTGPQIEAVPWTYLVVESVSGGRATCRMHTGLRSPLSRRSGRMDSLALGVRPLKQPTRLELVARGSAKKKLPGYDVLSYTPPEKVTTFLGRTDATGGLVVPFEGSALQMLLVRHGSLTLARLPIVPGLSSKLVAEIPDDDPRLEAEGFVTGWQESFVDMLARRQVLATQIRARISDGRLDEARKLLDELKYLVKPEQLAIDLRMQRQKLPASDAQTSARIDRLFSDTQDAVKRFLDVRDVAELEKELAAADGRR